jgi:hypothetical protein
MNDFLQDSAITLESFQKSDGGNIEELSIKIDAKHIRLQDVDFQNKNRLRLQDL